MGRDNMSSHAMTSSQDDRIVGQIMKRSTKAVIGGLCLGAILIYGWRWYCARRRIRTFHLTNNDLNYSDRSAAALASEHLIDLNSADAGQLADLGLSAQTQERLTDNRPYRNKIELVSRMILSQDEYAAIKDRVAVAEGNEAVKISSDADLGYDPAVVPEKTDTSWRSRVEIKSQIR